MTKPQVALPTIALLASVGFLFGHSLAENRPPSPDDTGTSVIRLETAADKQQLLRQTKLPSTALKQVSPGSDQYVVPIPAHKLTQATGAPASPIYKYHALVVPNDTLYSSQNFLPIISAPSAWNITTGSSAVIIAVVDTGFAMTHEDLATKWITNPGESGPTTSEGPSPNCIDLALTPDKSCNNLDDDSDGYVDNVRGWSFITDSPDVQAGDVEGNGSAAYHGTAVASVAAAAANNNAGIAGVCWQCRVLPIQVLDDNGNGDTVTVSNGIRYAADHGANVINISLGSTSTDSVLQAAINYALGKGVVLVAASGNGGPGTMIYPAKYPGVISVGATDSNDLIAGFSSTGPELIMSAPGLSVRTAYWSSGNQTSQYSYLSGTSIASPHVAGAVGLILSKFPAATASDVLNYLILNADKVAGMSGQNRTNVYGYGRLNTFRPLQEYRSSYYGQSAYPSMVGGTTAAGTIKYTNSGTATWYDDSSIGTAPVGTLPVHLATSHGINRNSPLGLTWGADHNRAVTSFAAVYLADGTTLAPNQHVVGPGQIGSFSMTFTAPATLASGVYREFFQPIVEGGTVMNDPFTFLDVTVVAANYSSAYAGQSAYPSLLQTQNGSVFLKYKNVGNTTWYDDTSVGSAPTGSLPVHLSTSHGLNHSDPLGQQWGGDRTRPAGNVTAVYEADGTTLATNQHVVTPGQIAAYQFSLRVPRSLAPGVYREFYQPIVEGGSIMNDPYTFLDVVVTAADYRSAYAGQCAYPTLTAGGASASCYLRYKNVGNIAWYGSAGIGTAPVGTLQIHLSTNAQLNRASAFGSTWAGDRNRPSLTPYKVYAADGVTERVGALTVDPGEIGEYRFTVNAPPGAARSVYREFFRLIEEGGSTMNDPGTFLDITVP